MLRTLQLKNMLSILKVKQKLPLLYQFSNFASERPYTEKPNLTTLESEIMKHPDTFGNYSEIAMKFESTKDDSADIQERVRLRKVDRRTPKFYIDAVKSHLNNHEYQKAVEVLDRMLTVDKVRPDTYIFDLLISYCGRTGNVPEAFRLYNLIKKRRFFVTSGQYTSLFNACANSRHSKKSLEVAHKIREYMPKPNIKHYNAMLKAFGRHGDLKTSLEIMDEVLEQRGRVLDDTYNFLLQACISDTNCGFRHTLLVWHRFLVNKTDPSTFTFNLILRAVRDCGLGAPQEVERLIQTILKEAPLRTLRKLKPAKLTLLALPDSSVSKNNNVSDVISDSPNGLITADETLPVAQILSLRDEEKQTLPNLLAVQPSVGSVISLASFTTAYHRLMLLGGALGFLSVMDSIGIKPDMKTFTLLLEIIPSTREAETDLINIVKLKKTPLDTAFFNALIRKRCFRFDYQGAKDVLHLMQMESVKADLITFGVLALACPKIEDGQVLITSVHDAGFRLNSEILGPLVRQATYTGDLLYIKFILQQMQEDEVKPSAKLMVLLEDFMKTQKYQVQDS